MRAKSKTNPRSAPSSTLKQQRGLNVLLATRWGQKHQRKAAAGRRPLPPDDVLWLIEVARIPAILKYGQVFSQLAKGTGTPRRLEWLFYAYTDEALELLVWARSQFARRIGSDRQIAQTYRQLMPGEKQEVVAAAVAESHGGNSDRWISAVREAAKENKKLGKIADNFPTSKARKR